MPTSSELKILRSWCGPNIGRDTDEYTGTDLDERLTRLGSTEKAALEVLREYQADLLTGGAVNFTVQGDYSQDASQNLKVMGERIARLEAIVAAADAAAEEEANPTVTPTVRFGRLTRATLR